jgi:hypothetical protein
MQHRSGSHVSTVWRIGCERGVCARAQVVLSWGLFFPFVFFGSSARCFFLRDFPTFQKILGRVVRLADVSEASDAREHGAAAAGEDIRVMPCISILIENAAMRNKKTTARCCTYTY